MEIKDLRYFLAIAREENMTRASELIHVSQSTLSKTVKALEEELGKKLFVRHSFSISLTDEGVLLRKRADDLVTMADKIAAEFQSMDILSGGDLYLGLAESYQIRYLAREIKQLKEEFPDLHYHITSGDTEQVTEKLDKGILDFAVLVEPPDANKYDFLQFPEADRFGLVLPEKDILAKKKAIRSDDLVGLPLFCSEQSWHADLPRWCGERMNELHLEGSFRLAYNGGIFVREGLGYLLTFDHLINTEPGSGLVFRPLAPALTVEMYLVWKKYQVFSPIAELFLKKMRVFLEGCRTA